MNSAVTTRLADAYRAACRLDVESFKPGNVSLLEPGHAMTAADFLRSAEVSATPVTDPAASLGGRVHDAVVATRRAVGCNTNLGFLLLIAPLVQAVYDARGADFDDALRRVLKRTTVDDARAVYVAIRIASPGGLGQAPQHDVDNEPRVDLRAAMFAAAGRDLIARQYTNDFADLLDVALPYFAGACARHGGPLYAMSELYLYLLARYRDTHVARKHGVELAAEVSAHANDAYLAFVQEASPVRRLVALRRMDIALKADAINPGTTADLCVATCFIHRLHEQAVIHTGSAPDYSRTSRPARAEAPHSLKSQSIEGDKQWQ